MDTASPTLVQSPPFRLETRRAPSSGEIVGIANTPTTDSWGTTFRTGCFARSLSEHAERGTAPLMLWQHNQDEPIGKWTDIRETAAGLEVRGQLNLDTQRGREAAALLAQGALAGLSVGGTIRDQKPLDDGRYEVRDFKLYEVSIVSFPANPEAKVTTIRSLRELERGLASLGLPKAAATRAAVAGWAALQPEAAAVAAIRSDIAALKRLIEGTDQ